MSFDENQVGTGLANTSIEITLRGHCYVIVTILFFRYKPKKSKYAGLC